MSNSITGILLFKKPNPYTTQSSVSPSVYTIPYTYVFNGISQDEMYAVGTCCGTRAYNQSRIDEYISYKTGKKSMNEIIMEKDDRILLNEYNWKVYYNNQMRQWFGDGLLDVY
jgi:hypothetical protein